MTRSTFKYFLLPFSWIYGAIVWFRNLLFDYGVFSSQEFDVKTICVGNLNVGGTGKSPMITYLIELLHEEFKVATLSRGYGRRTSGFLIADDHSDSNTLGDEPAMFKNQFPVITVAVDADRKRGITTLTNQLPDLQCILLDDAYQHRKVKASLTILLTDYNKPYYKDNILPYGTLREAKSNANRADIIIVTKCPENLSSIDKKILLKYVQPLPHQKVYFSHIAYSNPILLNKERTEIQNEQLIGFAGIANSSLFENYLKENFKLQQFVAFPDHYNFKSKDIDQLVSKYKQLEGTNNAFITTEKDYMRLLSNHKEFIENNKVYFLPIKTYFCELEEKEFNEHVQKYVRANKINSGILSKYN